MKSSSSSRIPSVIPSIPPITKQYKIAGCLYIGQLLVGYVLGWTAPIIPKLQDIKQTPLTYLLTDAQVSWVGSILYFGGIIGPYITGYLCNIIGRRPCLGLGGLICLLGFTVLAIAIDAVWIYLGRVMTGLSNGILFVTNLVYLGEIASTHIRGILLTITGLFTTLGTLLVYSVGPFVPYRVTCFLAMITAGTYLLLLVFIVPETPVYQVMKGNNENAIVNLTSLGRKDDYDIIVAAASDRPASNTAQMTEMFTVKSNKKALFIILVLNITQQMSGFIAVIFFVTTIFDLTGSSLESYISTIIVGITQVAAASITPFFVDRTGRKSLLLLSTAGCAISLLALGIYFYLYNTKNPAADKLQWLSLLSLIFFFISFNIGFAIIPNTFIGEMFTSNVRSFGSSFTVSIGWVFGFGVATAFGYMVPAWGAHSTFWMYSAVCTFAFAFTLFYVPETKGRNLLQIQEMLST